MKGGDFVLGTTRLGLRAWDYALETTRLGPLAWDHEMEVSRLCFLLSAFALRQHITPLPWEGLGVGSPLGGVRGGVGGSYSKYVYPYSPLR